MAGMDCKLYESSFHIESTIGVKSEDKESFKVHRAMVVLIDNGFKVFSSWDSLARELEVPLDFRRKLKYKASLTEDFELALEESLDYWMTNNSAVSWEVLLAAVERTDEKEVARKLYKQFGIGKSVRSDTFVILIVFVYFFAENNPRSSSSIGPSTGNLSGKLLPVTATPKVSIETKTFMQIQEDLQPLLQLSLTDFASRCHSKGLITTQTYDKVFNPTSSSDSERSEYLIHLICKRAKSFETNDQLNEARELIHSFGKIISEVDIVLRNIGAEISELYARNGIYYIIIIIMYVIVQENNSRQHIQ